MWASAASGIVCGKARVCTLGQAMTASFFTAVLQERAVCLSGLGRSGMTHFTAILGTHFYRSTGSSGGQDQQQTNKSVPVQDPQFQSTFEVRQPPVSLNVAVLGGRGLRGGPGQELASLQDPAEERTGDFRMSEPWCHMQAVYSISTHV